MYLQELGLKHEPLNLIPPQFEVPLPPLQPAVFPPILNEPPGPQLELFDLDEQFASERNRLAHLTNKCRVISPLCADVLSGSDDDLEYYVREAGEILSVTSQLNPAGRSSKHILEFIFKQIVNWKRLNPAAPMDVL